MTSSKKLTESICILYPIGSVWCVIGERAAGNVFESEICAVHYIQGPELRLPDGKVTEV